MLLLAPQLRLAAQDDNVQGPPTYSPEGENKPPLGEVGRGSMFNVQCYKESSTMLGLSGVTQWDTYLSNERYHGGGLTILSQISRPTHWMQRRLYVQHLTQGNLATAKPRSDKHNTISGFFHWQVAWQYHLLGARSKEDRSKKWELNAGAGIQTRLGFVYNTLGGNNPASARAAVNVIASAQARHHFGLWHKPCTATLQGDIPLTGLMFSPDYGQSYYEIFSLGHYSHNVQMVNPFRAFQTNMLLTLDCRLKARTAIRLGWQGQYMQSDVNGIKTQDFYNNLIIGFVRYM
ncbi:MAG: DUF3316 domain-containing protein [Bacteroidaceae bacterium]|nr:DUF3316 domain-containing protein [Bacteroidaceae bacterium]